MRALFCLPLTFLAAASPAIAQKADSLSLTYAVHVGGMHVLDADADMALGPDGYRAGLKMETDGFLGRVAQWKTDVRAQGHLSGPLPRPRQFTAHGSWRDQPRLTTVDYTPDGVPTLTLADPEPEQDREPVPADLRLGTVDPVSAIVAVLDQVAKKGDCNITVPVYDGRQRYDLVFATQGETVLEASSLSVYAGPATACSVQYKPLAGRWKENRSRDRDREGAKRKDVPVTLFIAPAVAGGPPVPVRLEMDSMLGAVKVHLAAVKAG
ncbi:DUF3108 domain-containing protein [Niveispirillum sp.]|uniref:DUF3108 domain-containing protein n=1 Tax=Niveispirillum sp. TaxID=1917217 RepID=UPI001B443ED5|nr:DUF3108 domain-containing protein [Niveispirillum sp.]MBP7336601.1 DUF3108 domain-containing protein [Niveispirillum sp.]